MIINNKIKIALFSLVLFCGAFVQQTYAQDNPTLKALEEMTDRATRAEAERDSFKVQLGIANERIVVKDEQIANLKEQSNFWKQASQTGGQVDRNSQLIIDNLRVQVSEDRDEITRLRSENDKLRSSRNWRTVIGFGAGFATGYFTKK